MALTDKHVDNVCKGGQGQACCSFLTVDPVDGWARAKGTSLEGLLRKRRANRGMRSLGDNCSGPPDYAPKTAKEN